MHKMLPIILATVFLLNACGRSASTSRPVSDNAGSLSMIITRIVDPVPAGISFDVPAIGERFLGVRVVIENLTDTPQPISSDGMILNTETDTIAPINNPVKAYYSNTYPSLPTTHILPGERIRGWVFFAIGEDVVPTTLTYANRATGTAEVSTDFIMNIDAEWEPTEPPDDLPSLNETASYNEYTMTVLQVIDPAEQDKYFRLTPGYRVVVLEVNLSGSDDAEAITVCQDCFWLIDDLGFIHPAEFGASMMREFYVDEPLLGRGNSVQGFVSFQLPEERMQLYVRYTLDWRHAEGMTVALN